MRRQLGLEVADLAVQFGDDADHGTSAGCERSSDGGWGGELFGS
jgi:hypothetical protein